MTLHRKWLTVKLMLKIWEKVCEWLAKMDTGYITVVCIRLQPLFPDLFFFFLFMTFNFRLQTFKICCVDLNLFHKK